MLSTLKGLYFSDTGKDTIIVFASSAINVLAAGIFFMLSVRILGPANYGLFATVVATGLLVVRLTNIGIDTGILRFASKGSASNNAVLSLALKSYLMLGALVAVIGFVLSPHIAIFLKQPQITNLLRISLGATVFFHLTNLFVAGLQANHQFVKSYIPLISNNLIRIVLILLGAYFFTIGLLQLTIIYFSVTIASSVIGKLLFPIRLQKTEKQLASDFFKFNIWIGLALTISAISFDNYFLLKLTGPIQTGLYAAPFKILNFVYEFGSSFTRVLASRFSSFDSNQKAIKFSQKAFAFPILLACGMVFLIILAKPVTQLVLGSEYLESVQILRILSVGFIFFFLSTVPSSIILYYLGKSSVSFFITLVKYTLFALLLWMLVPTQKAQGAAISFTIAEIVSLLLMSAYSFYKVRK